jgi:sulfatase maturation enzyme AslB (radical SAM superfamily)
VKELNDIDNNHNKKIIPKRLQIETIFGCNASCVMCPINMPTKRKKGIMPLTMSEYILDELSPYTDQIEKLDFFFLGEPLLDPYIFERIKYAKKKGFRNIAISTNASILDRPKQIKLLESKIDTVIFSIDGVEKVTYERIRKGLNFEQVVKNCKSIIKKRNNGDYATRFVIRFIRQDINKGEWESFRKYWLPKLSNKKNDLLICHDINVLGDECNYSKKEMVEEKKHIEKKPCHMVFDRLIILNNGCVPLCCIDMHKPHYCFGCVKDTSPIDIFNSMEFNRIRQIHLAGEKNMLKLCRGCTVLYTEDKVTVESPLLTKGGGEK